MMPSENVFALFPDWGKPSENVFALFPDWGKPSENVFALSSAELIASEKFRLPPLVPSLTEINI